MQILWQYFQEGGWFMYLVIALALPGLVIGIVHLAEPRGWSLVAGLILGLLTLAAGFGGTQYGLVQTNAALAGVAPQHRQELRAAGEREAGHCWRFGAIAGGVALLPLAIGEIRRRVSVE